jgi:glycosyltransferase involved in cell wall biosynthesis
MSTIQEGKKHICIIHPNKELYSETFIHNHIRHLPGEVDVLYRPEMLTRQGSDEKPLVPRSLRVASRTFYNVCDRFSGISTGTTFKKLDGVSSFMLRRFLLSNKIDAVLAEYGTTGVAVMDACRKARVPLIVHFHGFDAHCLPLIEEFATSYQEMFRSAQALIAVSHKMEEQLLSLGAFREKVHYNVCGVDTDLFQKGRPDKNPPHFIAIGRFVEKKAPHLTLLAFGKLLQKCSSARLAMIAEGPLLEPCKQIARALKMNHAVDFSGPLEHRAVARALQGARAFVQHSVTAGSGDSEGTPVGVLEAGASGLPVVSTRHAGIKDVVVENETGFLVDEFDIDGMADKMIQLAENPERALALGHKARKHVEDNFSMKKSIHTLWNIITECIDQR